VVGSQPYFSHTLLLEEFISGPEIVADTYSVGGEVRVISIAYKGDAPGPYFERSVYEAPLQLPTVVSESVRDQVVRGLAALGLRDGPSHTEMRLAEGGKPFIIEIGARVGGSGVSAFIVEASTGLDPFHLQVLQACGASIRPEDERPSRACFSGNFVIPMQGHGEFVAYRGLDQIRAHPATRHVVAFFEPGMHIDPIPKFLGFPGFIMSQHDSLDSLKRYHEWLFQVARIVWKRAA
jgi:biotin carboxylase